MKTVTTLPDGLVHIKFEKSNAETKLVDAIVVPPAQYAAWTEADVDAIIEDRWQNYLIAITPVDPPPEPVPPEGFEFERDEYGNIVYDENGEPVLVASNNDNDDDEITDVEFVEEE